MARSDRNLRRHNRHLLHRVEKLEERVAVLEAEVEYFAAKTRIRDRLQSQGRSGGARFARPEPVPQEELSADAGARVVARHLLQSGRSPEDVAAHLEELFDLPDAASVVAEVAYYDSGLSEPTQEGT
ncbi:MAG TPA: hypothetical protein VH683_08130 [Thermoleophilaceae bacterium]|jgi:uncharacterized small protein (DUF1192 family)